MTHASQRSHIFVAGDIYKLTTGGSLCDRLIIEQLQTLGSVEVRNCSMSDLFKGPMTIAGLVANLKNAFWRFPAGAIVWIDHGDYRSLFLVVWIWRIFYRMRVVTIAYHLDYSTAAGWRGLWRRTVESMLLRASDAVLTISQASENQVTALGFPKSRVFTIPVSKRFTTADIPHVLRDGQTQANCTFLFVGTVEPRKGLEDAIRAIQEYRGSVNVELRCVGGFDPESKYYQQLLSLSLDRADREIVFLGKLAHDDLRREFQRADVFLFPSRWEGYGIAIEEAFCFGLPVIAYRVGSIPELFSEDASEGWLVAAGNLAAYASAVLESIESPDSRLERGGQARKRAEILAQAPSMIDVLKEAIALLATKERP